MPIKCLLIVTHFQDVLLRYYHTRTILYFARKLATKTVANPRDRQPHWIVGSQPSPELGLYDINKVPSPHPLYCLVCILYNFDGMQGSQHGPSPRICLGRQRCGTSTRCYCTAQGCSSNGLHGKACSSVTQGSPVDGK